MKNYLVRNIKDLKTLLGHFRHMPDVFLGEMLVYDKLINEKQLHDALAQQKKLVGKHLGQLLIEMGLVTPEQVNIALARKLAIPYVKLQDFEMQPDVLSRIPGDIIMQYNVVPLGEINGKLVVAMENPLDYRIVEALRFNTKVTIEPVMASAHDITATLNRYYSRYEENEAIEDFNVDVITPVVTVAEDKNAEAQAQKAPIVRLLNAIILQAVMRNASDINIRPEKDKVNVHYRIDGRLQYSRTLSRSLLPALVSRIKVIGEMDIAERRLPQDGHARLVRGNNNIDLRISVIPTTNGESVVIRILNKEVGLKSVDDLGFQPSELMLIKELLTRSQGMILVTGPTGSGKSTTMYALLNELRKGSSHILTVEDPVEYDMEGVEQVQISVIKGYTFAEALRHFLRHDPDVIMVGEIRDEETARIANKAALTGHLVLSTLHTNDAASTISRLIDMGIEPYLVSSTVMCVIAQRLVRLNCVHCQVEEVISPEVRRSLRLIENEVYYRGEGCSQCNHTGYKGRVTVCEVLHITPEIMELINARASYQAIMQQALAQGMTRLTDNATRLARQRKTSIEEVFSVRLE